MNNIAQIPSDRRAEVFTETAERKGLPEAIVEKDFWVCWVLHQLFSIDALSGRLLFKGGTSLSKVFHAINRFSEDIDLAVDYAAFGFIGAPDPRQETISKTKRAAILDQMMSVCQHYIAGEFVNVFRARCEAILGNATAWSLDVSDQDPNVVQFRYPSGISSTLGYVAPQVVLELGTHAEFIPRGTFSIQSFVAEAFPSLVTKPNILVETLLAKRTFWEKVTILHAEYHRPADRPLPGRYSRHYYDVAMLCQTDIRKDALADLDLLAQVVHHKKTLYPSGWARYDLASPETLNVKTPEERLPALKRDYRDMAVMIFGEPTQFEWIIQQLDDLNRSLSRGSSSFKASHLSS